MICIKYDELGWMGEMDCDIDEVPETNIEEKVPSSLS